MSSKVTPVKFRGKDFWYVDAILDTRLNDGKREYLVHWKDTSPSSRTWEPEKNLKKLDLLKEFLEQHPEIEEGNIGSAKRKRKPRSTSASREGSAKRPRSGRAPQSLADNEHMTPSTAASTDGSAKRPRSGRAPPSLANNEHMKPSTPASTDGSAKRPRSGTAPPSLANNEHMKPIPIDFKKLLKQHLEPESSANANSEHTRPIPVDFKKLLEQHLESDDSQPFVHDRQYAFDVLTQHVSREHASLLFPDEDETASFLANMPDLDAVLAATEKTIAEANQPLVGSQQSTKKKLPPHNSASEMPPSKEEKTFVLENGKAVAGLSDVPSSSATSQTEVAAPAPSAKADFAKQCFANIYADFEEFSYSREKRDYMVSAFRALVKQAKQNPKSFEEDPGFDWEALKADQQTLAQRSEIGSTTIGMDLLHRQLAQEMIDGPSVLNYLANGSI